MSCPIKTQAERIYTHLRRKPHTYGEMLALRISTSPWKRIFDGQRHLKEGEQLVSGTNKDGLVTWKVAKVKAKAVCA